MNCDISIWPIISCWLFRFNMTPIRQQYLKAEASNYVYIMHEGQIKSEGTSEEIKGSSEIRKAYLGI